MSKQARTALHPSETKKKKQKQKRIKNKNSCIAHRHFKLWLPGNIPFIKNVITYRKKDEEAHNNRTD